MDESLSTGEGASTGGGWGTARVGVAAAALLGLATILSFWPSMLVLIDRWERDSNYSHGWLIIPIAGAILWQRRAALASIRLEPRWWGFLPLVALLALRVYLFQKNEEWAEQVSIPAVVGATVLAVGGWPLLRWSLPGVLFLFFMMPLPTGLNDRLAGPLQTIATLGSVEVLHILQQPVLSEGNVILIGDQTLEVAEACRGLSMLLSFAALITAMVLLTDRPRLERIALIVSIIPIAIFCNIIRISSTAMVYSSFHRKVETAHDYAGYAMMVLALGLVMLELKVLSWVVVDDDAGTGRPSLYRASYGPPAGSPR